LQDYNYKIVHIAEKANGLADVLSRMYQEEDTRDEEKTTALIPPDAFLNIF
jgi:hypothetical protein